MWTTLKRGGDGPDPVGLFDTYEEAQAYAKWAEDEEDGEYEVCDIATLSPLYPGPPVEPDPPPVTCPTCGMPEFEKRGTRRTYHTVGPDGDTDSWDEGDVEMDVNENGDEIIYCTTCESEWDESQLWPNPVATGNPQ